MAGRWACVLLNGFRITLGLGLMLVQLGRQFPSAGGYFTYISRTPDPYLGFLAAGLMTFYAPIFGGPIIGLLRLHTPQQAGDELRHGLSMVGRSTPLAADRRGGSRPGW